MLNKRLLAGLMALVMIFSVLATGCKRSTTDSNVLETCQNTLSEYLSTAGTDSSDGLIVYTNGSYYVSIGNTLYAADTFTDADAQLYGTKAGDPKILPCSYAGAGETILPAVASFRGLPYVEYISDGQQTAKACNYYLQATANGNTYYVSFYHGGTSLQPPNFINLYEKDGVQIIRGIVGQITTQAPSDKPVKNIIFMVADGGGYDNYTLAGKVKEELLQQGLDKLPGAKTEVTTDVLADMGIPNVSGLYLDEFLVGSANTLLKVPKEDPNNYADYITDSAAAGTALSSGYKTCYRYTGVDSDKTPRASLVELARLNGMSTGLVTTKSYVDATPLTFFTSHVIHRQEYQDSSMQAILSGIDVMIGEGTEYGDMCDGMETSHPDLSPTSMGYTVARNKTQMLQKANDPTTKKLWTAILGVTNSGKELKDEEMDLAADHISYDVDGDQSSEQPSLLDMTKAAIQVLGSNINDPDGFFLMIEGGALDNAAEPCHLRPTVGEYLAFDEAFAYCVDWAAERGDTVVIAVPDHDSGGFAGIEPCEDTLIDSIISGYIGDVEFHSLLTYNDIKVALKNLGLDSSNMSFVYGHSDMAVPICLYAPESVRTQLLEAMTLPTTPGDIRTGTSEYYVKNESTDFTWYTSSALNNDYTVDNTVIAPALAKVLELGSLDDATAILFNEVYYVDEMGAVTAEYGGELLWSGDFYDCGRSVYAPCTYVHKESGLSMDRNTAAYTINNQQYAGMTIGNQPLRSVFVLDTHMEPEIGTFYVPYNVLADAKLGWYVSISCSDFAFDKIITAKGTADIVLPAASDGKQIIYTDGIHVYNPGDTISYNGSNLQLTAYIK